MLIPQELQLSQNQQIAKQTPSFTPNNVKLGVFVLFKK